MTLIARPVRRTDGGAQMFREFELVAKENSGKPTETPGPCNCPCAEPAPADDGKVPAPGRVADYTTDYWNMGN